MIDLQPGTKVIDVGTGGGFPGIPLLIARPEIKLTMLDSTGKKLAFVSQSVEELGLSANIVHARAEEAGQEIEAHIVGGGDLSDLSTAFMKACDDSAFFKAMITKAKTAEKKQAKNA